MEYLNKSKICREFLNQYSDTLIPELLPKLMKVAIYALYKTFHKWNFSIQELDEFINFFNYKNRNFELESNYNNNYPCPPCRDYLEPKVNGIQKLNMGFRPPEEDSNTEENGAIDCYGYGKFYPNDDIYINEKNNFYDENYHIPKTHSYRNIQLYHKRLNNPKFITQEKKIYPHWWWNLKDDIEQDDYSEEDSFVDHVPSKLGRFPKNLEDKLKKKAKRFVRNKSYNGTRPLITKIYDESKIFPNSNSNLNTNNNYLDNSIYPKRNNSPLDDESRRQLYQTGYDGFGRPLPNTESIDPNKDKNISSPLYATTSQLYRGPGYNLGINNNNRPGEEFGLKNTEFGFGPNTGFNQFGNSGNINTIPNSQMGLGKSTLSGIGGRKLMESTYKGNDPKKSQIAEKRLINQMQSTLLSFDKDFNVNGVYKKVKGEAKKGLKYSLSGNKLIEDKRGIRRRPKERK